MRVFAPRPTLAVLGTALASLGCLLAAGRPAAAQGPTPGPEPLATVRVGGYFTSNSTVRHTVGSSFLCAGLDYAIQHQEQSRTIISVDYIDRSSGDSTLRFFPVTVGQLFVQPSDNGIQPYYGGGLGAYFVHQDFNRNSANNEAHDDVVFGGYLAGGVEFQKVAVIEARYHLVTSEHGINVSGLELTAGYRF
ncbi:MAG: hypothetical protein JO250_08245 [Armatimonadetes bacterium]|nr:hypothetical protein [Armatimonadota bacterium]